MSISVMKKIEQDVGPSDLDACWVKNTLLFRQWDSMKREILLHKYYESEKAGHDIGWDRAAVDWMIRFGPPAGKYPNR